MARKLDDIFNECYERIRSGESLKSCLKRYPEHAAELESLLKTSFDIGRRASYIQPRPEFKHWAQVRLEGAQRYAKQQRQAERPGLFSWRQGWAVAVTAILVLLLTGGSTVAASSNALPDQPLYPVKLATEQVRLAFAISDTSKAELHTKLAENRALEIETMADQGKTEYAVSAAEKLANQLEQANYAIAKVETTKAEAAPSMLAPEKTPPPPAPPVATTRDAAKAEKTEQVRESLEESTSRSLTALQNVLEQAPPQAKPALQRAIDRISEKAPKKPQQEPGTQDEDKDKDKDKGKNDDKGKGNDETKRTPTKPEQSEPSPQNGGETKNDAAPSPVATQPGQPSSQSRGKNESLTNPTSASLSQSQPAPQNDNKKSDGTVNSHK
ncbi:MAG: hypothetical protein FJ005_01010 [Chloroflexi bacterium]|nr:hypothetical protein [Chloroflexota bacterium]